MVVVSVSLAVWICVVWWQDKRTTHIQLVIADTKVDEEMDIEMTEKNAQKNSVDNGR